MHNARENLVFSPDRFLRNYSSIWFWATWEEDAPMRLRRWKVHKLGFKNFSKDRVHQQEIAHE